MASIHQSYTFFYRIKKLNIRKVYIFNSNNQQQQQQKAFQIHKRASGLALASGII